MTAPFISGLTLEMGQFIGGIRALTRLGEAFRWEDLELERVPFEGLVVNVATPQMLYRMKQDTIRPKDRIDAEALRQRFRLRDEP